MKTHKTAIVLGGTGATGKDVVNLLIKDSRYDKVKLFSRKKSDFNHPKIEEHIGDLFELEKFEKDFSGDEVYCCIGTTQNKTPNLETYQKIDFGIPTKAGKLAKQKGVKTFVVMSSIGANAHSNTFYLRVKGKMEAAILGLEIPNTHIIRPSLLLRKTKEFRLLEYLSSIILRILSVILIGPLRQFKAVPTLQVAKAMINIANSNQKKEIIFSENIENYAFQA